MLCILQISEDWPRSYLIIFAEGAPIFADHQLQGHWRASDPTIW